MKIEVIESILFDHNGMKPEIAQGKLEYLQIWEN